MSVRSAPYAGKVYIVHRQHYEMSIVVDLVAQLRLISQSKIQLYGCPDDPFVYARLGLGNALLSHR